MAISEKKKSDFEQDASSTPKTDDALLQIVRSILIGQEREQLKILEEKLLSWKNEVSANEKLTQTRLKNIAIELEKSRRKSSKEGLIKRLTPLMTNLLKQSMLDSPQDIAESLGPLMGSAIRQRVRTEKEDIVDALYPVIGESISKSVSEAVNELARNLDQRMHKRSPAERIAAQLQGISAGELLFRDNLPYQVQRVFIIHRNSGLLLAQTSPSGEEDEDLDMVSGMLTAIRDFAKDSLGEEGELNEIKHGDELILLQTSQDIYVAAVLSGTIPQGYHALSRLVLSEINAKHERILHDFDGDMDKLPPLSDELRPLLYPYDILATEGMSSKQKKSIFAIIVALILILSLSVFSCIFTIRLWPYAFPTPTRQPTYTYTPTVQPTSTFTPSPTVTATLTPTSTLTPTPVPSNTPTPNLKHGIATGNLKIHDGAGPEYPFLDFLYTGEHVIILEEGEDWIHIRREVEGKPELEGWVIQLWIAPTP